MNWIKTTEELPPVGCYVLGYVYKKTVDNEIKGNKERCYSIVRRIADTRPMATKSWWNWKSTRDILYCESEITYWTHLPNSPKAEGAE